MRVFFGHKFKRSSLWLVLFIGLLVGLGLARTRASLGIEICLLLALFALLSLHKRSWLTLSLVLAFGLSCGWARGSGYAQQISGYNDLYYQKVTITVRANEDATYNKYKQLAFTAGDVTLENGQKIRGKIQVSGFGVNAIYDGDEIELSGKFYPGYSAYQGRMSFAVLKVKAHHPSVVSEIRRKFVAGAQSALPEPLAPFVMGLLVGQRATLPEQVKEDLRMVGLTHIIAVSGYNLTIILQASRKVLGNKSKRISTFLSVSLIGVFLVLAGASASIVRAAIVSLLSILVAYYGRNIKPLNLICLAAVITAWANPVYIWSDLSWYLSFLAFFGVMVLAPLIQARWSWRWTKTLIGSVALESICAEIMTLPFVLHIFGQMSRVGLVANLLVVTLIPLAMLLGVVSGLAGMLFGNLAGWFSWPAVILLNYMIDVAHILAGLPNIFVQGTSLSLQQMLLIYLGVCLLALSLWHKSDKSAIITDMNDPKRRGLLA